MDKAKLIAAIVERHKVRLDEDDPAFILVDLNQIILDESIEKASANFLNLSTAIDEATNRLNFQTSQMIEAGNRSAKLLAELSEETKRNVIKAAGAAKQEQLHDLRQTMQQAAQEAMQAVMNERIGDSLAGIEKANKSLLLAAKSVNGAAAGVKATAKHWLWVAPLGSFIGVIIIIAGVWYVGKGGGNSAPPLTPEQQRLILLGSQLENVMPKLPPQTRANVQNALGSAETK